MKIFITGILGFIGSHLARHHKERGDEVWGIDNLSTGARARRVEGVRVDEVDLLDWVDLQKAVSWADGIYHMAATVGQKVVLKAPLTVLQNNIGGCQRLLEVVAAHHPTCKVLIASSSEVYGYNKESRFIEEETIFFSGKEHIQGNYALSKFVNEKMALAAVIEKGLHCVVIRLFNTTGVGQTGRYGMVVPRFVQQALHHEPITIFGDGKQTRSFCDVRDTVVCLRELLFHPQASGEIINVGNDAEISIHELAQRVKEVTKSDSHFKYLSYQEAYDFDFQETARRRPDLSKLRTFISHDQYFSLEETIREMQCHSKVPL